MDDSKSRKVGYGKPPLNSRFRPGISGNPAGRPKRPRDLRLDLAKEMARIVTISEHGKPRRLSTQRALVRSLVTLGLDGDRAASQGLLGLARDLSEPQESPGHDPLADEAAEALIAAEVDRRVAEELAKLREAGSIASENNAE